MAKNYFTSGSEKKKRNYLHIRWVEMARKVSIFRSDLATIVRYHEESVVHVSR